MCRESDQEEYNQFDEEFPQDKNLASTDCEEIIEEVAERIEKDLILLTATIVEDKLRNGVLECINKLAQAGRKLWVLTGDMTLPLLFFGKNNSRLPRQAISNPYALTDFIKRLATMIFSLF